MCDVCGEYVRSVCVVSCGGFVRTFVGSCVRCGGQGAFLPSWCIDSMTRVGIFFRLGSFLLVEGGTERQGASVLVVFDRFSSTTSLRAVLLSRGDALARVGLVNVCLLTPCTALLR